MWNSLLFWNAASSKGFGKPKWSLKCFERFLKTSFANKFVFYRLPCSLTHQDTTSNITAELWTGRKRPQPPGQFRHTSGNSRERERDLKKKEISRIFRTRGEKSFTKYTSFCNQSLNVQTSWHEECERHCWTHLIPLGPQSRAWAPAAVSLNLKISTSSSHQ